MRRLVLAWLGTGLLLAPVAAAASLPSVRSGQRPGPPLLYARPPAAPILSVRPPFRAPPLLISGTDAYRDGEYLYQDYLFDDRGANTVPLSGTRSSPGSDIASPTAGDVLYPTAPRYAGNAADLVELRVKPTPAAIVYRITLNTVKAPAATVVGIGIDTDRSGGAPVAWPGGAGISSPGLDRFITAWGTGGQVARLPGGATTPLPAGAVTIDTRTNQMTIRVPRALMDPGRSTWRYVAGVGLAAGHGWKAVRTGTSPTAEDPASGSPLQGAPSVFNLAFRFDEPTCKSQFMPPCSNTPTAGYDTFPGIGNWFEDKQAQALKARTSGGFHADVDFARLAAGARQQLHRSAGLEQARIFPSSLRLPEGVRQRFPEYGGQLQPYILTVPPGYRRGRPTGLTFALHSLGGTYTQYAVFSPNQLRQFGDQRQNLVLTTLGRGTDGWYEDEAEADFFEAWADVARHFTLDSERVALTGYSMGGYGTYKLGVEYPDLFARAFTTVGPPGREIWTPAMAPPPGQLCPYPPPSTGQSHNTCPLLENVRWIPYLNWVQATDELVPYIGPRAQEGRFDALGLRSQLWTFTTGEHFTLAVLDEWAKARDFLGRARVTRDPARVDYAFFPAADRPRLGLRHNHAYWVSGLTARVAGGNQATNPARAEIDARSAAFGQGDPVVRRFSSAGADPRPHVVDGTGWASIPRTTRRNTLALALGNIATATIDGRRARLSGRRALIVRLTSDGRGTVRLDLALPPGARARRIAGAPVPGAGASTPTGPEVKLGRRGATFTVASGTRAYLITVAPHRRQPAHRPHPRQRSPRFTG